jgi:hypothetical protein
VPEQVVAAQIAAMAMNDLKLLNFVVLRFSFSSQEILAGLPPGGV